MRIRKWTEQDEEAGVAPWVTAARGARAAAAEELWIAVDDGVVAGALAVAPPGEGREEVGPTAVLGHLLQGPGRRDPAVVAALLDQLEAWAAEAGAPEVAMVVPDPGEALRRLGEDRGYQLRAPYRAPSAGEGGSVILSRVVTGICAVPGVRAAHWTHPSATTGCTVVLFPDTARAGLAIPGHASGTRQLGALDPTHIAGGVHGFCLSGGSAFGLAVADGVMQELRARGIGFDTRVAKVPIVPTAILFDLAVAEAQPDAAGGRAATVLALDGAAAQIAEGRVGAGAGATVGKAFGAIEPGGFGTAALRLGPWLVGAAVAVNAFGAVRSPRSGAWLAGRPAGAVGIPGLKGTWQTNTTLAVVATDAPLDRAACTVVARMASAGLARAIDPVYTPFDGDTVFAASTGRGPALDPMTVLRIGALAADALAEAVVRGVQTGRAGWRSDPA